MSSEASLFRTFPFLLEQFKRYYICGVKKKRANVVSLAILKDCWEVKFTA